MAGEGADGNADGVIGPEDYDVWRANLGRTFTDPPPSGISTSFDPPTLTVTDSEGDDNIVLRQSSNSFTIQDVSGSWLAAEVTSLVMDLRGGNDYVSLDSAGNGGDQALTVPITVYSDSGNKTVRLANGHDVSFSGAHTLRVAGDGTATLDDQVLSWDPPPVPNWFDANVQDAALRTLGHNLYGDGLIDRNDMLALFASAEDGDAVDATEFSDLQAIVNNTALFGTSESVWKLSSYIVSGNTANAKYQGQTLGNLVAGSSATQLANLVNKWYLGLDRPATPYGYALASGTLFVNGPSYSDIDQGSLNNCAFMASLAETALRSPSTINSMFVVNGDGTYAVRFYHSGVAEYVTVDSYLPGGGGVYAGLPNGELWGALAEKAYAQVVEMSWFGNKANAYTSIQNLFAYNTLKHITGQLTVGLTGTSGATSLSTFATAYNGGQLICLISYVSPPTAGIVSNHAYAVLGYDAANQTVTLFNPWGINYGLTTLTWSQVQANFSYFDRTA